MLQALTARLTARLSLHQAANFSLGILCFVFALLLLWFSIVPSKQVSSLASYQSRPTTTLTGNAVTVLSDQTYQNGREIKRRDTLALQTINYRGVKESYLIECEPTTSNPDLCNPNRWLGACSTGYHHWSTEINNTAPNPSLEPYTIGDMYYCVEPRVGQCVTVRAALIPNAPGLVLESYRAESGKAGGRCQ